MWKHCSPSSFLFASLLGFFTLSLSASAQTTAPNEWTWMGGSNTVGSNGGQPGVYGTLGTPASGNIPGGREYATSWTDSSGNFWLFGGEGYDANDASGELNDLWEYNPSVNTWTWVGGSSTIGSNCVTITDPISGSSVTYCGQLGIYGTLGTPAATNFPGGRYGAVSWTDSKGNFWLFGGYGFDSTGALGDLNDLWEFNPSTKQWVWIGGSNREGQSGVYGSQGTPAPGNMPGARDGANGWIDGSGNLWLFGGSYLNDLWVFNPSTKQWTWMNGNTANENGFYGTIGTPAPGNTPSGKSSAVSWTDNSGNFWLMGGEGYSSTTQASSSPTSRMHPLGGTIDYNPPTTYGDLWEFDIAAQQWILISLDADNGIPGTLGVPSVANGPSGEDGGVVGAIAYTDKSGNAWILSPSSFYFPHCNDLMDFNPSTLEWAWMGGSCSYLGVYGTEGIPAAGNIPGGRAGAVGWTDSKGNFWLFGGSGADSAGNSSGNSVDLNDLWMYQPSTTTLPPAITPVIELSAGAYDYPLTFSFYNGMTNAVFYYTTDGTTPTTGSAETSGSITLSAPATVKVIAVASGYPNSGMATATFTQEPTAATPTFSVSSGTYTSTQTVTISDTTPNASIEYSLTSGGTTGPLNVYSGSITIALTETLSAIAVASGYNNSAVASATYTIPPDFAVTINPASISVPIGESGTTTITVQDEGGFNSNVSFACSGLPQGAACSFTLETVPTPAGISYSTLTVTTSAANAALHRNSSPLLPGSALAAVLFCFGLKKRRRLQMILLLAVSAAALSLLNGCSSGSSVQPVTSTITVTATSGSLSHSTTFSLTVD